MNFRISSSKIVPIVGLSTFEALEHPEEEPCLIELADGVVEVELLQHLPHVLAEAGDVVAQVGREVWSVVEQLLEVVSGGVVERKTRRPLELGVEILQPLATEFRLAFEDTLFSVGQHAVEPAQHRERKDHVLVLAALEGVADQVRDSPEEAHDLAMVHCVRLLRHAFALFASSRLILAQFHREDAKCAKESFV